MNFEGRRAMCRSAINELDNKNKRSGSVVKNMKDVVDKEKTECLKTLHIFSKH
jgi:hypothetical protein